MSFCVIGRLKVSLRINIMITALVGAGRMGCIRIVSHLGWTLAGVSDRSDAAMEQIKSQTCKGSLLCTNDVSDSSNSLSRKC